MANPDTPFGLRPALHLNGSPYNGATLRCYTSSGGAAAIYLGDLVDYAGDACARGCCPEVTVAASLATTTEVLGVMTSCDPYLVDTTDAGTDSGMHIEDIGSSVMATTKYRLAKEERFIECVVDPNVIFECQGDTATTSAVGDAGMKTIFIDGGGNADTGLSGIEVDVSGAGTTLRDGCFVWGMVNRPDHGIGINDIYYVILSTHVFGGGTAGRIKGI
jgi:hypothetical protein